ncbi:hypothetical protein BS17DRAFT_532863 [Gyrodon lividus]|nr:hypothetical protein BS17DRAFT_532863 [Gyrodon lividus]
MASVNGPRGRGAINNPIHGNPATQSNRARGRGNSKPQQAIPSFCELAESGQKESVHWMHVQTDLLVSWLTSHSADCHILFYKNKGDTAAHATDKPSTKDKMGIHEVIAKGIFEMDTEWT